MNMLDRIRSRLSAAFEVASLDVVDESALHAGHSGARPGGETHYRVRLVSPDFIGTSRVDRQRKVYAALADEIRDGVHALALETKTPEEVATA